MLLLPLLLTLLLLLLPGLPRLLDLEELDVALEAGHHGLGPAHQPHVGHAHPGEIVVQALNNEM